MLGLGAVEMVAFDCMRPVRAREVVARAYGDAGTRCADGEVSFNHAVKTGLSEYGRREVTRECAA